MHLIVYSQNNNWVKEKLREAVQGVVSDSNIHVRNTLNGFIDQFRESFGSPRIGIIAAQSVHELNEMQLFKNLLRQIWTIIILPDSDPNTIKKAYRLWPRYISDLDSDLSDVRGILSHMKQRWLSEDGLNKGAAEKIPVAPGCDSHIKTNHVF